MSTVKLGTPRSELRTPLHNIIVTGITSAEPTAAYMIPVGSTIKIYPTSAGTASVYSSSSNQDQAALDVASGNAAILAGTNANWDIWGAGAVTAKTIQSTQLPITACALVVTSGTWTMEVVAP